MTKANYSFPVMLVITSDKKKVTFLKRTLRDSFYVIEAISGQDGLDWFKNTAIDCIILDEKVEDIPPLEFCKKVRKTKDLAEIPIILITSNLKKSFIFQALNEGVTDFLRPPLDELEVNQRIAVAVKSLEVQKKMSTLAGALKKTKTQEHTTLEARFLLNELILKQITAARKKDLPLALLLVEVDEYPDLHKKWSAPVLEEVLGQLSALIGKKIRTQDHLYSLGVGKFLILFPKTSKTAAIEIAKTIQIEVASTLFETKKVSLSLTVSMGMVSFETAAAKEQDAYDQFDRILTRVHGALEKAKETGNKIVYK
jgi:diguanylate cyclase (GGDEF)-like protein